MKEKFKVVKFQKRNSDMLEKIAIILKEFEEQGIKVTLRQLYYQLVSRGFIPNLVKEYKKLSDLLTNARYSGAIDWDAIEDRVRQPHLAQFYSGMDEFIEVVKRSYRLNGWEGQDNYIELWTEKDALSSVIIPITNRYQVPFIVNRGYTSSSSIYDSAKRLNEQEGKTKIILYLGDHDPSGMDMDRDIIDRLEVLGVNDVKVIRIALTLKQIKQYNPPENPTKQTDPRAKGYYEEFGGKCWEVDALRPDILMDLIEKSILQYLDLDKFEQVRKKELEDIRNLKIE